MPSGRPPGPVRFRDVFLLGLLLPTALAALQQQPAYRAAKYTDDDLAHAAAASEQRWRLAAADSLHTRDGGPRHAHKDTGVPVVRQDHKNRINNHNTNDARTSIDERALATVSPAGNPAVRAPPAQRSPVSSSAGLDSRRPARSLQDWKVEDIMLLATVDGKLHARDRKDGAPLWTLEVDREMVEIINHRNHTDEEALEDPMFIVEPSQDGDIYIMVPGYGLQKLGYTVRQLAELAPYASQGYPAVAYTAEKKNTLYTVDAATGNILKSFSSAGSFVNEDRSCRRVSPFDSLDEKECEPIGTLTIGRTEYTIGIQDRNTGEPINTIHYFEWGPNNHDIDLRNAYTAPMDHRYVYSRYDGTVLGLDLAGASRKSSLPPGKALYRHKFPSPVVRVFDVVREELDPSQDASLVVLPQPKGRSLGDFAELDDDIFDNVFINCTELGNWYALSEVTYPMVTTGAQDAMYLGGDFPLTPVSYRELFSGVHHLSSQGPGDASTPLLDGSELRTIESPPLDRQEKMLEIPKPIQASGEVTLSIQTFSAMLAVTILALGLLYKQLDLKPWKTKQPILEQVIVKPDDMPQPAAGTTMIREDEPAVETVFDSSKSTAEATPPIAAPVAPQQVRFAETTKDPAADADKDGESDDEPKEGTEPKKRKATRGKRGGRKQKEKQQAQLEARAKKANASEELPTTEIISVAASENPESLSGPLQINSLVIHTDKVIGQGGCGTMVFEGSWEGKAVAVKRMLSQYYELASQEVHFLQQSYHANVVRYFCQQKDNHFLYIAVELCQASLFEVWEAEKARTEERQNQLRGLKLAIQQDMSSALHQLAAGLSHLHTLRIIHRDIKPQNILVAYPIPPARTGTRLVISDFGLGKNLPENVSTLVDPTGNAGTSGWKAPELISQPKEDAKVSSSSLNGSAVEPGSVSGVKRAADIFSLGCLFFWVLTDGVHPFEDENGFMQMREVNIKRGKKNMDALAQWSDAFEPMHLITSMLAHLPEHRPTALEVVNHPYFWKPDRRLDFLCDCSDHFEREPRGTHEDNYAGDSDVLHLLESRAAEVIVDSHGRRGDFLARLDRQFVDTLGKQRKYSGNRLLDLLRALRNKKNHYEDMPEDVKKRVGPLAGGYLNYWCHRFPKLLMACYEVVHEAELQDTDRFRKYFEVGN